MRRRRTACECAICRTRPCGMTYFTAWTTFGLIINCKLLRVQSQTASEIKAGEHPRLRRWPSSLRRDWSATNSRTVRPAEPGRQCSAPYHIVRGNARSRRSSGSTFVWRFLRLSWPAPQLTSEHRNFYRPGKDFIDIMDIFVTRRRDPSVTRVCRRLAALPLPSPGVKKRAHGQYRQSDGVRRPFAPRAAVARGGDGALFAVGPMALVRRAARLSAGRDGQDHVSARPGGLDGDLRLWRDGRWPASARWSGAIRSPTRRRRRRRRSARASPSSASPPARSGASRCGGPIGCGTRA